MQYSHPMTMKFILKILLKLDKKKKKGKTNNVV